MSLQANYRNGRLTKIALHDPTAVKVWDFRNGGKSEPFVSVHVTDGETEVVLFFPPELVNELGILLWHLQEPTPESEPS